MGQSGSKKQYSTYSLVTDSDQNFVLERMDEDDSSEDELFDISSDKRGLTRAQDSGMQTEAWYFTLLQIFIPFILAGLGMVAAGLVLDIVQHWDVFIEISEIFILVPALLGLKGNLEMTLASRLSTAANLGKMDTRADCVSLVTGNLALIQCQAIVIGFLASLTGLGLGYLKTGDIIWKHGLLMCASSVVTASLASFVLGLVMVAVIIGSRSCKINPDNVATPIAASLGDLTTLGLLSWIANHLWDDMKQEAWLAPLLISCYLLLAPVTFYISWRNPNTRDALLHGWTPVILSMLLSSGGGLILEYAVDAFNGIAVFQPVMNGVGGNLVAVQASRMSTHLHTMTDKTDSRSCVPPLEALCSCSSDPHSHTARLLLLLVVPGHLVFTFTISHLEAGHTDPTPIFLLAYMMAAILQVALLLYICRVIVFAMWNRDIDPDNSAIPYLTALGDLFGGAFLALAFLFLSLAGEVVPSNIQEASSNLNHAITSSTNLTTSTLSTLSSTVFPVLNETVSNL